MHRTSAPRVIVHDLGVDAALVQDADGPVLVLSPAQSFENAVDVVGRLLPQMHPDAVRSLVREHIPESADFDAITGTTHPGRIAPARPRGAVRALGRVRWPVAAAALSGAAAALGVGLIAHQWGELSRMGEPQYEEVHFFAGPYMPLIEDSAMLECTPSGNMTARCTDIVTDRTIYLEAGIAPTSVLLWAIDGSNRSYVRVFTSDDTAEAYEDEGGGLDRTNFVRVGSVVGYGEDPDLIGRLMTALIIAEEKHTISDEVSQLRVVKQIN